MWNKLSIALFGLFFTTFIPSSALAETVMEKVARTGVLTIGSRTDTIPYAYVNDKQELVGYSIDVIQLIKEEVQRKIGGREITVQLREISDFKDLIPALRSGEIDIACNNQFTWQREDFVDFSISYSISGIRLLTKTGNTITGTPESLAGKRIGVVPNSLGKKVIETIQPKAILVSFAGAEDGFPALESGKVDALAADTIILAGNALKGEDPEAFQLVPVEPYARYGIGCMIPENNSSFRNTVNRAIAKMIQGYVSGEKKYVDMVNQWIGPQGIVPIPEELIQVYFQTLLLSHEQIPLTENPTSSTQK